jgi:hypothetical protein
VRAAAELDATQARRGQNATEDMRLSAEIDLRVDAPRFGRVVLWPGQLARRAASSSRDQQQTPRSPSARAHGTAATSQPNR